MERWRGKVAVVTGASAGIGAAIARLLAEEGLQVVGLARRMEKVQALTKDLVVKPGGKLHAMQCDVTKQEDIERCFRWVRDNLGPVHVLVNNAGIFVKGMLIDGDPKDWKRIVDTNILGLSICTQQAIKQMQEPNIAGHIVHISSISAHWPLVGDPPVFNIYSPTKFAVKTLTEVLRQELSHCNSKIKVTSISPGLVDTELFDVAGLDNNPYKKMLHLTSEQVADAVAYVLGTPPNVLIQDLIIRPLGSM